MVNNPYIHFSASAALRLCRCRVCSLLYACVRTVLYLPRRYEVVMFQDSLLLQLRLVSDSGGNYDPYSLYPFLPLLVQIYDLLTTLFADQCMCTVVSTRFKGFIADF